MTVILYTTPSCASCKKAREWLIEHKIEFKERNMFNDPLSVDEIKKVLLLTENGTEDIVSTRSQMYQSLTCDINKMPLKQLLQLMSDNPTMVRRPLMIDGNRLQVGYNEDEIRCFLPRELRLKKLKEALEAEQHAG